MKIATKTYIKWLGFRLLEWLSDLRGNATAKYAQGLAGGEMERALWVFVSTIGELNAIEPFLKRLLGHLQNLRLVLITDQSHYVEIFKTRYPQSVVQVTLGHSADARELARIYLPALLIVGEIPCWPSDAPCRFSFAYLLEARRRGAITCIVNAWLYYYPPSCRMDVIERKLFQTDYLNAFDLIAAQSDEVKESLIKHGAEPYRVHVTGNLKFDALPSANWSVVNTRSPLMLGALLHSKRPVIVAGCITNLDDQNFILDAFQNVQLVQPNVLLVIAPRHPEVKKRMQLLEGFLQQRAIPYVFKSRIFDAAISPEVSCLVLDTIGELRDFYGIASVAHVGKNHNILEPIGYRKPVTVQDGWNDMFPSYPVYRLLHEKGGLIQVNNPEELGSVWERLLVSPEEYHSAQDRIDLVLNAASGSLDRLWAIFEPMLPSDSFMEY